jgi:phosphoribosylaminoimidazole-succinocarboxamide synthase
MDLGPKLAEGKTKIIYAHPTDSALAIMVQKDSISAGDGARRNVIPGKGALSGRTAANVFGLLNHAGIATHFVEAPDPATIVVRRCRMIPLEVVMRGRATGSYLKRNPEIAEGARFDPPLVEFFLKDDARHDPQIAPDEIAAQGIATADEVDIMTATGRRVFETIERAWAEQDVMLVDLKIEFGRPIETKDERPTTKMRAGADPSSFVLGPSSLVVADMIDNDSWRLWPGGDQGRMLDKQVYRNMREVTDEGLEQVRQLYQTVAGMTDEWKDTITGGPDDQMTR